MRQYGSTLNVNNGDGGNVTLQTQLYGGVMLGTPPVLTIFNGQTATLGLTGKNLYEQEDDYLRGLSFELYHTAGNDTFGVRTIAATAVHTPSNSPVEASLAVPSFLPTPAKVFRRSVHGGSSILDQSSMRS